MKESFVFNTTYFYDKDGKGKEHNREYGSNIIYDELKEAMLDVPKIEDRVFENISTDLGIAKNDITVKVVQPMNYSELLNDPYYYETFYDSKDQLLATISISLHSNMTKHVTYNENNSLYSDPEVFSSLNDLKKSDPLLFNDLAMNVGIKNLEEVEEIKVFDDIRSFGASLLYDCLDSDESELHSALKADCKAFSIQNPLNYVDLYAFAHDTIEFTDSKKYYISINDKVCVFD